MSDVQETARAVQSVAKLSEKALEKGDKVGRFFTRVFKAPIEEVSGMLADKLRFARWKRLMAIADEVNTILKERGVDETRAVPPKLALPIFEEGSLEDNAGLQNLWNHLLANAMDPDFDNELRYGYIDIIKSITSVEAMILNRFYDMLKAENHIQDLSRIGERFLRKEQIMGMIGIDDVTYVVGIHNLMRVQCVGPAILKAQGVKVGSEAVTINKGTDSVVLTPLGLRFVEACMK